MQGIIITIIVMLFSFQMARHEYRKMQRIRQNSTVYSAKVNKIFIPFLREPRLNISFTAKNGKRINTSTYAERNVIYRFDKPVEIYACDQDPNIAYINKNSSLYSPA
jgi:hypothetical protein